MHIRFDSLPKKMLETVDQLAMALSEAHLVSMVWMEMELNGVFSKAPLEAMTLESVSEAMLVSSPVGLME